MDESLVATAAPTTDGRGPAPQRPAGERSARSLADLEGPEPWSLAEHLARTVRATGSETGEIVATISSQAVRLVPGTHSCGVIVTDDRQLLRIVATTDPVPRQLDELQKELGAGPCLTAARKQIVVRIHDVAADTRWPRFRDAALDRGVASMLCLPLDVDRELLGTLSLYSTEPGAFRDGAEPVARLLAALAAVALAESRHAEHLRAALVSRDLIGQAKGILMRERRITADDAFTMLRQRSQNTNTKLVEVAQGVIEAGTL
jgi:GAF domain-containing protein